MLDFSASINPFGMPPGVRAALLSALDDSDAYPDPDCCELRSALAGLWKADIDSILVGNGSTELIHLLVRALKHSQVVIPVPTFSEYENAVRLSCGNCRFVYPASRDDFSWSTDAIGKFLAGAEILFLCTPNSPTGYLMPKSDILNLYGTCKRSGTILVIDETFLDFAAGADNRSFIPLAARSSSLIVLRSFTKLYAVPGLRLGYLVGAKRVVRKIRRLQPPWMVNTPAQEAGIKALADESFKAEVISKIEHEKKRLLAGLNAIDGITPYPSAANFLFCRLDSGLIDSVNLTEKMVKKGVLIRDCSTYRGLGKRFIRLAVRKREENERLLVALKECTGGD